MKNLIIFVNVIFTTFLFSQNSNDLYNKMITSYYLGFEKECLIIASDLLSYEKYADKKEETLFFIINFYLSKSYNNSDSTNSLASAKYFFELLKEKYPNSNNIEQIELKFNAISEFYSLNYLYFKLDSTSDSIKQKNLTNIKLLNKFFDLHAPNSFIYFEKNKYFGQDIAKLICNEIIDQKGYEEIGYYYKILFSLSKFRKDIIPKKIFNTEIIGMHEIGDLSWDGDEYEIQERDKILKDLEYLNRNYSKSQLTLELNLIIGQMFMEIANKININRTQSEGYIKALFYLNKVIANDKNIYSYKKMLARIILDLK